MNVNKRYKIIISLIVFMFIIFINNVNASYASNLQTAKNYFNENEYNNYNADYIVIVEHYANNNIYELRRNVSNKAVYCLKKGASSPDMVTHAYANENNLALLNPEYCTVKENMVSEKTRAAVGYVMVHQNDANKYQYGYWDKQTLVHQLMCEIGGISGAECPNQINKSKGGFYDKAKKIRDNYNNRVSIKYTNNFKLSGDYYIANFTLSGFTNLGTPTISSNISDAVIQYNSKTNDGTIKVRKAHLNAARRTITINAELTKNYDLAIPKSCPKYVKNNETYNYQPITESTKSKSKTYSAKVSKDIIPKSNLTIEKVDENGSLITSGTATFNIYSDSKCTKKVKSGVKTEKGKTKINKLELNTYYIKEVSAPTGYNKNNNCTAKQITLTGDNTIKIINNKKTYTLTINYYTVSKYVSLIKFKQNPVTVSSNTHTLITTSKFTNPNADVNLYDSSLSDEGKNIYLNRDGYELKPEAERWIANKKTSTGTERVKINQSTVYEAHEFARLVGKDLSKGNVIVNIYLQWQKKPYITLKKYASGTKKLITGKEFTFELRSGNCSGTKIGTFTSNTGKITMPNLSLNSTYSVLETQAPRGYVLPDETNDRCKTVKIEDTETIVEMYNDATCTTELNNLKGLTGENRKKKLIELYKDYPSYNQLLDFNNAACAEKTCGLLKSDGCLSASGKSGNWNFGPNDLSCYNGTVTIGNDIAYCLTTFSVQNATGKDHFDIKSGSMVINNDYASTGEIIKTCYATAISKESSVLDSSEISSYFGNMEIIENNSDKSKTQLSVESYDKDNHNIIKNMSLKKEQEGKYVGRADIKFAFPRVYSTIGSGKIKEGNDYFTNSNCQNCKYIGNGFISSLTDNNERNFGLSFDFIPSTDTSNIINFKNTSCSYNVNNELVDDNKLNLEFRSISENKAFPGLTGNNRKTGSNWSFELDKISQLTNKSREKLKSCVTSEYNENNDKDKNGIHDSCEKYSQELDLNKDGKVDEKDSEFLDYYNRKKTNSSSNVNYLSEYIFEKGNNSFNKKKVAPKYKIELTSNKILEIRDDNKLLKKKYGDWSTLKLDYNNNVISDYYKILVCDYGMEYVGFDKNKC